MRVFPFLIVLVLSEAVLVIVIDLGSDTIGITITSTKVIFWLEWEGTGANSAARPPPMITLRSTAA